MCVECTIEALKSDCGEKYHIVGFKDLLNEFNKVAGYRINIQKLVAFLYTNNEISEREYKQTIPFKITSKKNT